MRPKVDGRERQLLAGAVTWPAADFLDEVISPESIAERLHLPFRKLPWNVLRGISRARRQRRRHDEARERVSV